MTANPTTQEKALQINVDAKRYGPLAEIATNGDVVQPSEVLYKRPLLVERGTFRPPTKVTFALLESARERFLREPDLGGEPVVLMVMMLPSLTDESGIDHRDFIDRAEVLHAFGHHLAGGRLEAIGRLFKNAVKVYAYPTIDPASGALVTAETMPVPESMRYLYAFFSRTDASKVSRTTTRRFSRSTPATCWRACSAERPAGSPGFRRAWPPSSRNGGCSRSMRRSGA